MEKKEKISPERKETVKTNKIISLINEWQNRKLDKVYPIVFIDAVHFSVKDNTQIIKKTAYIILRINTDGFEDVLGINEEEAHEALIDVSEKWKSKYPYSVKNWEDNWDLVILFFKYSEELRKIMYTTNAIESLNSSFRRYTKNRTVSPNDASLRKSLYLATQNIIEKWTARYQNWDMILSQLQIFFEDRI